MNKILLVYDDYVDLMAVESTLKKAGFDVIGITNEYSIPQQILSFHPDLIIGSGSGAKVSSLGVGRRLKEVARWEGMSILVFPPDAKPSPAELLSMRVDMLLEAPASPMQLLRVVGRFFDLDEAALIEKLNKTMHFEYSEANPARSNDSAVKAQTEKEPIFVTGQVPSVKEGNQSIHVKPNVIFSTPMKASKPKIATAQEAALKEIEKELVGGGVPESEKVEGSQSLEELQAKARNDLEKSQKKIADRMAKYKNMVKDVKIPPEGAVSRSDARRRQKELSGDWDNRDLEDLDKLRRNFAGALFKK